MAEVEASPGEAGEEFRGLCAELNMDTDTADEAWRAYSATRQKYTLEGDQLHWLACALYVACRRGSLPTVGRQVVMEGNGVSLTRLLRSTKLSLIQFFTKAKLWADMCNLKTELVQKIDKLERNFAVSNVIFKKYQPIFVDLFVDPSEGGPKQVRSRKQKRPPCTAGEVFDFCWTLFIRVKGHFPAISDDLVNSYHLLLSCVDYIYSCAWTDARTDLLNPVFDCGGVEGLPVCILERLCTMHDGILTEVKSIREHWLKPYIKSNIEKGVLRGRDDDTLLGLLDLVNFDTNSKNLRRDYETYVLSIGEYDERVFLGEEALQEIGTPSDLAATGDLQLGERISVVRRSLQTQFDPGQLVPGTPLSGRHYLRARDQQLVTPVSSATYLVERLNKMVAGRKPEPTPGLLRILAACAEPAAAEVVQRVERMGEVFTARYNQGGESSAASFAGMRLVKGQVLYYRVLENLLAEEQRRGKSIGQLVQQAIFHQSLFAACLEVVIFSHYSQKTFPWIIETFQLEPFYFFKVIEVLIRAEEGLVRDVVKHLQHIEEQILESLAWAAGSSVWALVAGAGEGGGVPSCEEVSLPTEDTLPPALGSPLSHHLRTPGALASPIAADRFKSPIVTAVARRQLFSSGSSSAAALGSPGKLQFGPAVPSSPMKGRSPRTGGLVLFYRKVYHLAHLRLDNLSMALKLDTEMKRRIWTCLEWVLINKPDIMRDRHLDQVIMCVLYVVCKVTGKGHERTFTDIMKHYRSQPQATSHIYRSVLLAGGREAAASPPTPSPHPPPTPGRMAASSTVAEDGEERGDLIKFYNAVFLPLVQDYAMRFKKSSSGSTGSMPPLSPLPQLRANPSSPRRKVSEAHSVFTRPLRPSNGAPALHNHTSPVKPLSYSFSRSPAKNLAAINEMVASEGARRAEVAEARARVPKRLLVDEEGEEAAQAKVLVVEGGLVKHQQMVSMLLGERADTSADAPSTSDPQ